MNRLPLIGILALSCGAAFAQSAADQAAIRAVFQRLDAAIGKKNAAGIRKEMTADAYWIDEQGNKTAAASQLAGMEQQLKAVKTIRNKTTVKSITFKGGKAIVTTSSSSVMLFPNPQTKKDVKIEVFGTATDTLVKVGGAWKVQVVKQTSTKALMDGKPMPMPQAGGKGRSK